MEHLHQLQSILNSYTTLERRHYISNTDRHEDDASHSLSVAMICWHYHAKLHLSHLSEVKIFKYALIHDLVEVYAGDVATHASAEARKQKEIDEAHALRRLTDEFAHDTDLIAHLHNYQHLSDEEARFVWTCDKIQAYIQGSLDNWRPYLEYHRTLEQVTDMLHQQAEKVSVPMRAEFDRLMAIWIASYSDALAAQSR